VKNQGGCGACYAFAGIGNVESKVLIDTNTTTPGPDYSENNAKSCTWRAINNWTDPWGYLWGNCNGGNYYILASLFSQKGIVDETNDPYVPANTTCNSSCPYNKTLLDWRVISGNAVPNTIALKTYIQTYGPVYTTLYVDPAHGFDGSYNGAFTYNVCKHIRDVKGRIGRGELLKRVRASLKFNGFSQVPQLECPRVERGKKILE